MPPPHPLFFARSPTERGWFRGKMPRRRLARHLPAPLHVVPGVGPVSTADLPPAGGQPGGCSLGSRKVPSGSATTCGTQRTALKGEAVTVGSREPQTPCLSPLCSDSRRQILPYWFKCLNTFIITIYKYYYYVVPNPCAS